MTVSKPAKQRITLADLAAVEVPKATLVTDTLAPKAVAAQPVEGGEAPVAEASTAAASDSRDLSSMPAGVSPEIAEMLAMPEPEPEPEPVPNPVANISAAPPVIQPKAKSKTPMWIALTLLVVGGAAGAFFATQPPALDGTSHAGVSASVVVSTGPEIQIAYRPIPAPIVLQEAPTPSPPERSERRRRRADESVRSGDLF